MSGVNKAILIGNLGSDPEIRNTANAGAVANFSIATNETWTDRDGAKQERTEWHKIVLFGKQAELARDYLKKGRQVYIEGRIQTREWQDKDGNRRFTTEIVGNAIQFLGGGDREANGAGSGSRGRDNPGYETEAPAQPAAGPGRQQSAVVDDDDIPF